MKKTVTYDTCNLLDEVYYKPKRQIVRILCKSHNNKEKVCISGTNIKKWVFYSDLKFVEENKVKNFFKKLFSFSKLKTVSVLILTLCICLLTSCKLNGENDGPSNYGYININEEESILSKKDSVDSLIEYTSKGTHYLFIGWTTCKWCQYYIPYYNKTLKENGISELVYFSPVDIKGYKIINDENNVPINADYKNTEYKKLINWILKDDPNMEKEYLKYYEIFYDNEKSVELPWLYVPRLYKIIDGKIIGVVNTLKEHEVIDGQVAELTEEQKQILYKNINNLINLTV